jgi:hypothetical protein
LETVEDLKNLPRVRKLFNVSGLGRVVPAEDPDAGIGRRKNLLILITCPLFPKTNRVWNKPYVK